jgi:hypothetical protein
MLFKKILLLSDVSGLTVSILKKGKFYYIIILGK